MCRGCEEIVSARPTLHAGRRRGTVDGMVSLVQLEQWIAQGEGETLEFKATTAERTTAMRTLCGMLNHRGGRVLFGVGPEGEVRGQGVSDQTLLRLRSEFDSLEPPVFPTLATVPLESGRRVIVVAVERGPLVPYSYKGEWYRRVGSSTVQVAPVDAHRMFLERVHGTTRWENQVASGLSVADLDTAEITRTLEEAIRRGRTEDPGTRNPVDILRGFGLLSRDGQLLNAAVVLFGRADRLLPDYAQCLLRVARFVGYDKTEFSDSKRFQGNAFELLRRAERYLAENLPIAGKIAPDAFERSDEPLYPPLATREALANAFCHRDYSIGGGSVGVAIFDDRLEITSSGDLHFGLTVEDLFEPHESLPWNPLIANTFYSRGIIESWGRGVQKMAELMVRAGLPRPHIEASRGAVVVQFTPRRYVPPEKIRHDLSARQRAVLAVLAQSGPLLVSEIYDRIPADVLEDGVGLRHLREDLQLLKEWGVVWHSGRRGRGSRWALQRDEPDR